MNECNKLSRREALGKALSLVVGAAVVSVISIPRAVAGKAAKSDFYYQETPKNGQSCSSCRMFMAQANGRGGCALLEGDVVPTGWCMAYSPKAR